jgi:peptidoglycan hydrolase CwlO-like protein
MIFKSQNSNIRSKIRALYGNEGKIKYLEII